MSGHEVYKLEPAQLEAWKKTVEPLRERWAADVKKTGGDPDAIWKSLQDTNAKYGAGL